jgi:Fe-S cluster assembly iron-binding protein IscA
MSKVDDVFDFADELVDEWGSPAVFVRREDSVYDPNTGEVTQTETRTDVKVVISSLDITEDNGLYQANDVKLIIDPVQLNYIYITEQDYFELPKAGGTEIMKVIDPKTYRGERPVAYVIIARPQ